ncbi:MAG: YHS domain-containing protein, partial [Janthinobacterium lividum]
MTHDHHDHGTGCCGSAAGAAPATAKDPVCGMTVDPAKTQHHAEHAGATYHFCCNGCRTKFEADPAKYLSPALCEVPPVVPGAVYVCPMDPEVRQMRPGACPICGMALEPEEVSADAGPNVELIDMRRRTLAAAAGTLPVVALAMGAELFGDRFPLREPVSNGVQLALASLVVFWAGWPFVERGLASLRSRHLNMFTLVMIGTGVAWAYSAVATLAPGLFPPAFHGADGAVGVYFEAAAVITLLVLVGQVLELKARDSTATAIRGLLDL